MEGLTQIRLPTLPCSFPLSQPHPSYAHLQKEIDEFCKCSAQSTCNEKELDFIVAENWPFLAAIFWPTALESRLPWVTKFLCWFVLLDTKADDIDTLGANGKRTEALMHKYIEVIEGRRNADSDIAPGDMFLSCFVSFWEHFRSNMSSMQYARLFDRMSTLFTLIAHQSKLREEGVVLCPDKLLQLRRVVSAGRTLVLLMEYAVGIELNEDILNRPEIQEIEVACIDHMVTENDILSFRKEYLGRDFNNLPSSFCMSNNVDFQRAVYLTSQLVHDADHRFCELHASISKASYFTPQVKAFIDGLGYMMSGFLEWSWHTARYHGLNWVVPLTNERQGIMYLEDPPKFQPISLSTSAAS